VIDTLGHPEFTYSRSGKEYYTYYGLELVLEDGKVTQVPFGLSQEIAKRQGARKEEQDRMAAMGNQGGTKRQVVKQPTRKAGGGSHGRSVKVIANGGRKVDVNQYVGKGMITVVDFYADWCGPCRKVAPHLEKLASNDADVNLVKIDIVTWDTPVVAQYSVKSVPNMRVYGRTGKMVGKPTSDFRQVQKYVTKAR
jgi:thiol-disulfide isomerase/thioredoxin